MFSDDDDGFFAGRGRSPSPEQRETRSRQDSDHRRDDRRRDEDRRRDDDRRGRDDDRRRRDDDRKRRDDDRRGRDDDRRPDFIKRDRPARTTGREIPKLYSIHKGTIVRVQDYGAFVRLGDGSTYKDGLLHISRLSSSGRVDSVADVVSQDDIVWVKVIEVKEEEGKFSLDMRFVGQKDGEDQDPGNVQVDTGRKGSGKSAPEPIRIGAIQATTCSRCGARGHAARECWSGGAGGKHYDLVEEAEPPSLNNPVSAQDLETLSKGHDASVVKAALKAYFKRKAEGKDSSSSSSSSSDKKKKKDKKKEKKQKKKEKKAKKKETKPQKKAAKEAKKAPPEG